LFKRTLVKVGRVGRHLIKRSKFEMGRTEGMGEKGEKTKIKGKQKKKKSKIDKKE
jgi:hypothetical protein